MQKKPVDFIYLDYANVAFDSVVHLLHIYYLDMVFVIWCWIGLRIFWSTRILQCVRIQDSLSAYCAVTSGVPQGSVWTHIIRIVYQ